MELSQCAGKAYLPNLCEGSDRRGSCGLPDRQQHEGHPGRAALAEHTHTLDFCILQPAPSGAAAAPPLPEQMFAWVHLGLLLDELTMDDLVKVLLRS